MSYRTLSIVGVSIFVLIAYIFWPDRWPIVNYPPGRASIIAFGDSLVAGVGSTEGNDFVSVLSRDIQEPIANRGVSGNTTHDGLSRLDAIIAEKPGTVLLLLGGNDYLRRIPREVTMANLEQIITRLQGEGALVVLLGVRGGLLRDNYEVEYRMLAKKTGSAYVSNVMDGILGNRSLMSDQIHPNDAGYAIIAKKVADVLVGLRK